MFTGLIQQVGSVEGVTSGRVRRLDIRISKPERALEVGESIAIEGVCLTVTKARGGRFSVEAVEETIRRSTMGALKKGDSVNVERSLCLGDRMGGHLVLGHVDAVSEIVSRRAEGDSIFTEFRLPAELGPFVVEKGSIAIDGISLTVANLSVDQFGVALIPETLRRTTLGRKRVGARVNLEGDIIGKYVARLTGKTAAAPRIDEDFLRRAGFA
jgi:riboflavin synthase